MFMGFSSELPWSKCDSDFSDAHCYSVDEGKKCNGVDETFFDHGCMDAVKFCAEAPGEGEDFYGQLWFNPDSPGVCSRLITPVNSSEEYAKIPFSRVTYRVSPTEEYFYKKVLGISIENGHLDDEVNSWTHWGSMQWEILGCLALSWAIICICLIQGIQSYGKVAYFVTLFPYVGEV